MDRRIFFIDGHAMVYRAHYAFITRPLINSKGQNVSAINGFVRSVWELIVNQKPSHIGVVFDPKGGTFRSELYAEYKAQRDAQPEDISLAIPYIIAILEAMNIPVEVIQGFEADDVIGTLAKKAEKQGFQVYMVTPDKDYAQLVSDNIFQYKPASFGNGISILGPDDVLKKWEIKRIDQVIDMLGLMGDSVDNIPGLPGVGPKTAVKLLAEYDNVENILANADKFKGKLQETIIEKADLARLSKELATIKTDVPVEFEYSNYEVEEFNKPALMEIFKELEFKTLAATILGKSPTAIVNGGKPVTHKTESASSTPKEQGSLFDMKPADVGQQDTFEINLSNAEFDISNTTHTYHTVLREDDWQSMLARLNSASAVCFDTETTGLDPLIAELVGFSFAIESHEAWYVPVPEDRELAQQVVDRLKTLLENPDIQKIGQNLKYDVSVLFKYGVRVQGILFDTMLMHYLIEPEQRHGMDYMAEAYLKYKTISITSLIGDKKKDQISMRDVPLEQIAEYAAEDADITLQLYNFLMPGLQKIESVKLYEEIESPLIYVLADMESAGVRIDGDYLNNYSEDLKQRIAVLAQKIIDQAGYEFNINSPRQVGELLFDSMKIPYRWSKTKQGQYSTDEDKMSELALEHPIVGDILQYRGLAKLKSTYVDALPQLISPVTHRVHSSFNQALAATGRLSSNNPNLQNIPIKTQEGREIRKAFIPADDTHVIFSADYSQIELRLIAELSKDKNMVEAFQQGLDIHTATAAKVYEVPLDQVTPDQRRNAKTVNFSIIYGAGSLNLSRQLNIKRVEAKTIIDQYFNQFDGLKSYMDRMVHEAHENGYVKTMMGRKRYLRDINSRNTLARSGAERIAINSPVQGSAADLIKIAMINIHEVFRKEGLQSKMIMQVHDELVFDVLKSELDIVREIVVDKMKNAIPGLQVPIEVSTGYGTNWLEAH